MNDDLEQMVSPVDDEELWIKGKVYFRFKCLLVSIETAIPELEDEIARARYRQEITRRVRDRMAEPEAREVWEDKVQAAGKAIEEVEQNLVEANADAAYCREMIAEVEAELGDRAGEYAEILADLEWDEDELDELAEWGVYPPDLLDDEEWEEDEDD